MTSIIRLRTGPPLSKSKRVDNKFSKPFDWIILRLLPVFCADGSQCHVGETQLANGHTLC